MRFENVCIESFGYTLPEEIVTSDEIEQRLRPLYQRLRLPEGRLELMTGIQERRFWPRGAMPSQFSVQSGNLALEACNVDRGQIGVLVHASVCRDHLEPATACRVHHLLELSTDCLIYDVSNACLGILNGIIQVANMIELGQVQAGLVVGTEGSRQLVETTIDTLNKDSSLTRNSIKMAVASLTIGSGSCAVVLTSNSLSTTNNRLVAASAVANTAHHELCHSGRDEAAADGMQPLMHTDSETLMREGIGTGVVNFDKFLDVADWNRESLQRTFCHQVGAAHRKLMLESLKLPEHRDFSTLRWLGNTGSVALPITMAIGAQQGFIEPGENVGMLGIGSGINCIMLGAHWNRTVVAGS